MKTYYDRRAPEYDDWYLGVGLYADRVRPGWGEELASLIATIGGLQPGRTLDVACGTGFLTRHLPGEVVGLDASETMLEIARQRVPDGEFVIGDALDLPFPTGSFDRVLTGHFYGHLEEEDRLRFLAEARRVAPELVVVDSALHEGVEPVAWQERVLSDGSRWPVYKRYLRPAELAEELNASRVLHSGRWFVAVAA